MGLLLQIGKAFPSRRGWRPVRFNASASSVDDHYRKRRRRRLFLFRWRSRLRVADRLEVCSDARDDERDRGGGGGGRRGGVRAGQEKVSSDGERVDESEDESVL